MKNIIHSIPLVTAFAWAAICAEQDNTTPVALQRLDRLDQIVAALQKTDSRNRVVLYGPQDVVDVRTRLRFSTLILLPEKERIIEVACGDKDSWVINSNDRFVHIKPTSYASRTNLTVIAASGNIYSFALSETSAQKNVEPDLKIVIEAKDESMIIAMTGPPKYVLAQDAQLSRARAESADARAQAAAKDAKELIQREVTRDRTQFVSKIRHAYVLRAKHLKTLPAMYHDEHFTYIDLTSVPGDLPTIYAFEGGKPSLVKFDVQDRTIVVSKLLEEGYLVIGSEYVSFVRRKE